MMRFFEFDDPEQDSNKTNDPGISNLLTVLNHLINRYADEGKDPVLNTQSLINMVRNTGIQFDYPSLISAYEEVKAVKDSIRDLNKDTVKLNSGEAELPKHNDDSKQRTASQAVSRTAQKAATRAIKKEA